MAWKTSMSVSVPNTWKTDVKDRSEELGYDNVSEYVRSLIREDIEEDDETSIVLAEDGNGDLNEAGAA